MSASHYRDVIMMAMASLITGVSIVCSNVYSGADQRQHQSSASLNFLWGINRWPENFPHKGPVRRKIFPFDDVIVSEIVLTWMCRTPLMISQYCFFRQWLGAVRQQPLAEPVVTQFQVAIWYRLGYRKFDGVLQISVCFMKMHLLGTPFRLLGFLIRVLLTRQTTARTNDDLV